MTDKFKEGDRVKVTGMGTTIKAFGRGSHMDKMIGKTYTVKSVDHEEIEFVEDEHNYSWHPVDLELALDRPRPARVLTEKVTINGTKCYKILGFEGILGRGELPEKYLEGSPMFYNEGTNRGHGHFEFDGERLRYFGTETIVTIKLGIPRGREPIVDTGYIPLLNEGDVWPETTFQNIMVWLQRAGSRLAKIREAEKASWSGKETFEI